MYCLVVKTSFGVLRLSFKSPHFRVGIHIIFGMVVCPSVLDLYILSYAPLNFVSSSLSEKIVSAL